MQITKVNCPTDKYGIKCPYAMVPEGITVHNTANDASAMSEISYMLGNGNQVSFHAAVDDYRVVQGIEENRNTWACGDGANGFGNRKTINIEICYSKSGGERFDKAEELAAEYVASLLKKYGWGIEKVGTHQNRSAKYCPHRTLDMGWNRFLDKVRKYLGVTPTSTPGGADQILRVGSIVRIDRLLTVTGVSNGLIAINELTGAPSASYHWFDPTNFDVVDDNGNKTPRQVCYVGCKVRLNGEYRVTGLVKTEAWACKLHIGNRDNWVWTEPCYEVCD